MTDLSRRDFLATAAALPFVTARVGAAPPSLKVRDERVETVLLTVRDGVSLIRVRG